MKRLLLLATAILFVSGASFAHNGGDKGKGKKKPAMHNCPGKQCSKRKV